MKFKVIDNKTGKEADAYEIALHEEWAQGLVYCDMEGFAITEDGYLVLMDECGHVVYCDTDRFKVVFEYERPQWIPCSDESLPKEDGRYIVQWCGDWGVDVCIAKYSKSGKYWLDSYGDGHEIRGITAWMPLPSV